MSRVDDRIRARLHLQIALCTIAVLAMVVGVALSVAWLLWPAIEGSMRPSHYVHAPSYGSMLRESAMLMGFGGGAFLSGLVLLMMVDRLAARWIMLRHHGICPECDYPLDDPFAKTCPDCARELHRNPQAITTSPGDAYRAEE